MVFESFIQYLQSEKIQGKPYAYLFHFFFLHGTVLSEICSATPSGLSPGMLTLEASDEVAKLYLVSPLLCTQSGGHCLQVEH